MVQIPIPLSASSRLLYELLSRVHLEFLAFPPDRIACKFLHLQGAEAEAHHGYSVVPVVPYCMIIPFCIQLSLIVFLYLFLLKCPSKRLGSDISFCVQVLTKSAVAMAVAQEVLRITPPVRVLYRRATEDIVLGDIAVPAGTDIMMAPRKVRCNHCSTSILWP
jgi:hypothetical protein